MGAGSGGTSTTIGRLVRSRNRDTQICVVDVQNSAVYDVRCTGDMQRFAAGSGIEGQRGSIVTVICDNGQR